jgi:hypothetical protein
MMDGGECGNNDMIETCFQGMARFPSKKKKRKGG